MPTSWTVAPATGRPWMSITRPRIGTSSLARRSTGAASPPAGSRNAGPYPSAMATSWADGSRAAFTSPGDRRNEPSGSVRVSRTAAFVRRPTAFRKASPRGSGSGWDRYTVAPATGLPSGSSTRTVTVAPEFGCTGVCVAEGSRDSAGRPPATGEERFIGCWSWVAVTPAIPQPIPAAANNATAPSFNLVMSIVLSTSRQRAAVDAETIPAAARDAE